MRRWLVRLGVSACVVLVLVAGLVIGHRNGLICFSQGSGGPPTTTTGPVTISSEHSVYEASDTIGIITNHLSTTLYVRSSYGEICPTMLLDKRVNGSWWGVPLCVPYAGEAAPPVFTYSILAQSSTAFNLIGNELPVTLADGTYWIGVSYTAQKPDPDPRVAPQNTSLIWSAAFRVCTCRIC